MTASDPSSVGAATLTGGPIPRQNSGGPNSGAPTPLLFLIAPLARIRPDVEVFFVVSRARKPIGSDFHGRQSSKASAGNTCTEPAVGGTFDALKWRGQPEIPSKADSSLLLQLPGTCPRSNENVRPMSCLRVETHIPLYILDEGGVVWHPISCSEFECDVTLKFRFSSTSVPPSRPSLSVAATVPRARRPSVASCALVSCPPCPSPETCPALRRNSWPVWL